VTNIRKAKKHFFIGLSKCTRSSGPL